VPPAPFENLKGIRTMIQFKKISEYDINIEHTINSGILVRVGCCKVVFNNSNEMLSALEDYYRDPDAIEKIYNNLNKTARQVETMDSETDSSGPPSVKSR